MRMGSCDELSLPIGYLASYDGTELSQTIAQFSKVCPDVTISVFKGTHEDLYHSLRSGKSLIVLNDQRRAFSDEYENFVLKQSPAYVEFSVNHPLARIDDITTAHLENYPCILIANKQQEKIEQDFYENTLGIGKLFIFAENLDDAKLMALSGRGYMLVERIKKEESSSLLQREVKRPDFSPIVRTYCAFWQKKKTNCYIEEFARLLRQNFTE